MSSTLGVISSCSISRDQLVHFITSHGGKEGGILDGMISRGSKHVWLGLSNIELEFYEPSELERIRTILGDEPKSNIVVEIRLTVDVDSKDLAAEVICALTKLWNCAIDNLNDHIYTADEFCALPRESI